MDADEPTKGEQGLTELLREVDPAEMASRMVTTFRASIPSYQRLPAEMLPQILAISRQNAEAFLRGIEEGRAPTEEDLEPFRQSARRRASEGMPLEDLLHAYRLGGRVTWEGLRAAAEPAQTEMLLAAADLLMEYVDLVSAAVANSYLEERQHLVSETERRLRELLDAILSPEPVSAALREFADRQGIGISGPHRPFAVTLTDGAAAGHARLAATLRGRGALAVTEGDRVVGLATPASVEVALFEGGEVCFAIGEAGPRPELAEALEDLRMLVDLARRRGQTGEVEAADLLTERLLARSPRLAVQLRRSALGPLEAYAERRSSDLLETLAAFLDCGLDRRKAAEGLHVHTNTLQYRLGRIEELTGLSLDDPRDLTTFVLALSFRELDD